MDQDAPLPNDRDQPEVSAPTGADPTVAGSGAAAVPRWYERTAVLVPLVVLIAPAGAALLWLSRRWPLWARGLATAWAVLVIVGLVAGGLYLRGHGLGLRSAPAKVAATSAKKKGTPAAQAAGTPKPKATRPAKPATPTPAPG